MSLQILYWLIPLVLLGVFYSFYATVVARKNKVLESLSDVDVQLNKRHDLIPNILQIAQRYLQQEQNIFSEITALREQLTIHPNNTEQKFALETQLGSKMQTVMARMEAYPELRSDNTMVQAMQTYNEVEEHIAAARRFYNSAISALRNAIEIFPGTLFKGMAGETAKMPFYQVDDIIRAPVQAADYFKAPAV